jgi:hypothetical protein
MYKLIVVLLLCAAPSAYAGPFGLEMGMPLSKLKTLMPNLKPTDRAGIYETKTVPKGHPRFTWYLLLITPQSGLCKVLGVTEKIETSDFGTQLVDEFDRIADALEKKYGNGKRLDELRYGSMWTETRYWMMGLLKGDRTLQKLWSTALPDNLDSVLLEAVAFSNDQGGLKLGYEFTNFNTCRTQVLEKENEGL